MNHELWCPGWCPGVPAGVPAWPRRCLGWCSVVSRGLSVGVPWCPEVSGSTLFESCSYDLIHCSTIMNQAQNPSFSSPWPRGVPMVSRIPRLSFHFLSYPLGVTLRSRREKQCRKQNLESFGNQIIQWNKTGVLKLM